jgi:molecular chaperone DnaK
VSQHPDEAVALGAVLQAGILEGSVRNVTLLDVTPLSLGIETFGGLMNVLIPRNTTIPVKKGEMFTNAVAGQTAMRISVLQGERELAKDNWRLGEFDLAFTPAPKGQARVGVQFEIDANGILNVLARDIATATDTVVEIRSAVDVSDTAVETMIGASVEHAFEDMADRQFVEARLKAEEMLPAIDVALVKLEGQVPAADRERIDALVAEVRGAIADQHLQRLKKRLGELDDATQELATLLLESLMN